jgi:translation initiation factor 4A
VYNDREKYEMLGRLYGEMSVSKSIIYCNSVRRVMNLFDAMCHDGFSVCCIHSNMDKAERERVFSQFRNGDTRILISSDITARGIDVQQVSTVINFDLTRNVHTYLHRIGRGGRWGRKGTAVNLLTRQDVPDMRRIEKYYHINIEEYSFRNNGGQ